MSKKVKATLYMESKLSHKGFMAIFDPQGYLFSEGKNRTKILPADLPEWYIHGYIISGI